MYLKMHCLTDPGDLLLKAFTPREYCVLAEPLSLSLLVLISVSIVLEPFVSSLNT